jgi:hypothetical protein
LGNEVPSARGLEVELMFRATAPGQPLQYTYFKFRLETEVCTPDGKVNLSVFIHNHRAVRASAASPGMNNMQDANHWWCAPEIPGLANIIKDKGYHIQVIVGQNYQTLGREHYFDRSNIMAVLMDHLDSTDLKLVARDDQHVLAHQAVMKNH